METRNTLARAYFGIVSIPIAALLLAGALNSGDGGSATYGGYGSDRAAAGEQTGGFAGSGKSEAQTYGSLGHLNPCIFIVCEGEQE